MDRERWLRERRAAVVDAYDADASSYDRDPYPNDAQVQWVRRVVATLPAGSTVLDVPCGTGRYFDTIAAAGHRVVGIDQSAGMLAVARARGIASELRQQSLQDLDDVEAYDAIVTIDAMENVSPEDWPRVLRNLRTALKPPASLYLTIEEADDGALDAAYSRLVAAGAPAVRGEVVEGDVAGYHYYPGRDRALGWVRDEGLDIVDEDVTDYGSWAYRHLLLRRA